MANPQLAKIGVTLVVDALDKFLRDMKSVDKSIRDVAPASSLLEKAFSSLGGIVNGALGSALRVLEYTLGNLIAGAIQSVVKWLREMGAGVLEAADTFQKLEIRLERLNFNAARDSGMEYNEALEESIRLTREQLNWTMRLGATTPYDAKDIANIYTLARGYQFTADEAKTLIEATLQFTAGMGLSRVEMERIIINFGQLRQQGKLSGQDLRDLARGAFVPINKVLETTALKLGLTTEEFNKQRKAGTLSAEAVNVFRESFEELVGVNFEGAAQELGNVFSVARQNVEGLIRDMLGAYVVGPVFATIGKKVQQMTDAIVESDERWGRLINSFETGAVQRISQSIQYIVESLLDLAPSADLVAENIVGGLEKIADWLETHRDDIVKWVKDAVTWLQDELLPSIVQVWGWLFGTQTEEGAIQKFGAWLKDDLVPWIQKTGMPIIRDLIDLFTGKFDVAKAESPLASFMDVIDAVLDNMPVILDLLDAFGEVIAAAFGGKEPQTFSEFIRNTLVPALSDLANWIRKNKTELAFLLKAFLAMNAIVIVVSIIFSIISAITMFLVTIGKMYVITGIAATVILAFKSIELAGRLFGTALALIVHTIIRQFSELSQNIKRIISEVMDAIRNRDWAGVGTAIINGLIRGIQNNTYRLIDLMKEMARQALNAVKITLGIQSPSKVFYRIGEQLMSGFAQGITEATRFAVKAMQDASAAVTMPAIQQTQIAMRAMPSNSVTNNTSNQYTLNIKTNAPIENIIQDFNLLESLA